MTGPERHNRIGELFDAALELQPEQREEFLRRACGEDEDLRSAVQRLLENHCESGTFLDPVLERPSILQALATGPDLSASVAGPYKIIRQLGEGGMGVVYLAQQEQPIRREVALKVIKPGMDSGSVIARFNSERQSLALMDHPNIAQVYDAGTTSSGLPYFAMELVDGIPITQFCSEHQLSVRERIELFIPVCQAIHHAHQKGIIHRDIKPSNVLVKVDERKAIPKVIDFGLAKVIGNGLPQSPELTHVGTVVGTLQYMSPEQASMDQRDVDTRSDIYSLGAMLYELLTGSPPLDADKIGRDNYLKLLQSIREEEPMAPNVRLRESAVRQPLDSELDWIPLKALEKERERRYETVNGLVQDLLRYLAGEPVEAAPPSRIYRFGKFVRRNRPWILTATAFVLFLLGGIAFSAWMAVRATRAEREARAIADFLQYDLLSQANPDAQDENRSKVDPRITVRTVVDRASAKLNGRFRDQPEVEASLRHTIGSIYSSLGLLKEADPHLRRAVEMRTTLLGPNAEATLEADVTLAYHLTDTGDSVGAEKILKRALEISRRLRGPADSMTLNIANALGWTQYSLGKMDEAIPMLQAAEQAAIQKLGPYHRQIAMLQSQQFANFASKQDYVSAEQALKRASETRRHLDGSTVNPYATEFGMLYSQQGRFEEAAVHHETVLAEARRNYGLPHPTTLIALYNLAECYTTLGRYAEAEALFRENYKHRVSLYKPDHPRTMLFMSTWARFHTVQGKLAEADAIYSQYLPVLRNALDENHPTAIDGYSGLADLRRRQKRYDDAEAILIRTLASMRRTFGNDNPDTFYEMGSLARVRIAQGRYAEAESPARDMMNGLQRVQPDGWQISHARCLLGQSLAGQKKFAEALVLLRSGVEGLQKRKDRMALANRELISEAQESLAKLQSVRPHQ